MSSPLKVQENYVASSITLPDKVEKEEEKQSSTTANKDNYY